MGTCAEDDILAIDACSPHAPVINQSRNRSLEKEKGVVVVNHLDSIFLPLGCIITLSGFGEVVEGFPIRADTGTPPLAFPLGHSKCYYILFVKVHSFQAHPKRTRQPRLLVWVVFSGAGLFYHIRLKAPLRNDDTLYRLATCQYDLLMVSQALSLENVSCRTVIRFTRTRVRWFCDYACVPGRLSPLPRVARKLGK